MQAKQYSKDFYEMLGIDRHISDDALKKRLRKLKLDTGKEKHFDKTKDPDADKRLGEIFGAIDELERYRHTYDLWWDTNIGKNKSNQSSSSSSSSAQQKPPQGQNNAQQQSRPHQSSRKNKPPKRQKPTYQRAGNGTGAKYRTANPVKQRASRQQFGVRNRGVSNFGRLQNDPNIAYLLEHRWQTALLAIGALIIILVAFGNHADQNRAKQNVVAQSKQTQTVSPSVPKFSGTCPTGTPTVTVDKVTYKLDSDLSYPQDNDYEYDVTIQGRVINTTSPYYISIASIAYFIPGHLGNFGPNNPTWFDDWYNENLNPPTPLAPGKSATYSYSNVLDVTGSQPPPTNITAALTYSTNDDPPIGYWSWTDANDDNVIPNSCQPIDHGDNP